MIKLVNMLIMRKDIKNCNFPGAVSKLCYLPEEAQDTEVKKLIEKYEGMELRNITSISYIDKQDLDVIEGTVTDSRSNEHEAVASIQNASSFFGFPLSGNVILPTDGEYTRFYGKIACGKGCPSDSVGNIQVYGDDKLIYQSGDITNRMEVKDFDIDVTGVKDLEIKFNAVDNGDPGAFASGSGIKMLMIEPTIY